MPEDNIDMEAYTDKHGFAKTSPEEMLSFLWSTLGYGELKEEGNSEVEPSPGEYLTFSQKEFYPETTDWDSKEFSGRENGYVYIPNQCKDASSNCRVHFVLHGCGGKPNLRYKQYNGIAVTNDIIMVYPDTRCWDSGGLIDPENYKTNNGIVHKALKSMLERVTRESDNPTN